MPLDKQYREQFNRGVEFWAEATRQKLEFKLASIDLKTQLEVLKRARGRRKPLSKAIRTYTKEEFGQAEIIRFSFPVHGWYFDRGVGKETPIERAGTTEREPQPWIEEILERELEVLADAIVEIYGDDVLDDLKLVK